MEYIAKVDLYKSISNMKHYIKYVIYLTFAVLDYCELARQNCSLKIE